MLLIVGGESDPNTRRVVDQSHIRDVDYLFWDTDDDSCLQIAWDFDSQQIDLGNRQVQPSAIYMRWNVFGGDSGRNMAAFETIQSYALAWPGIRMLNRGSATDTNNKSYNLRLALTAGFTIPETMVMSNLAPLKSIPSPKTKIAKPLSGGAHAKDVSILADDSDALGKVGPQFIQERLDGENLRVFSIGGKLFAFHLKTTELDYRDDPTVDVISVPVPDELIQPTQKLVEHKQFDYCALDFRCREGFNDPVFLEVNSFPMFVRFDDAGRNNLADAILDFLVTE